MQIRSLTLIALFSLVLLAGCGEREDESEAPAAEATATATETAPIEISDDLETKPTIPAPEGSPPAELQVEDIVEGDGKAARKGAQISVQYVGASWSTGQEFDASWDRGEPFAFQLGAGSVIPGWDEGLVGMKEGGRRKLTIPPDMGYGAQGSPPAIAPNETLIFVVDLLEAG